MLCISARFVALLGLCRPMQREQLQWPVRLHLCGGGAIKAPDGGESGAHAASRAREQAQRHHCLNVCPRDQRNRACLQLESPSSPWEETAA